MMLTTMMLTTTYSGEGISISLWDLGYVCVPKTHSLVLTSVHEPIYTPLLSTLHNGTASSYWKPVQYITINIIVTELSALIGGSTRSQSGFLPATNSTLASFTPSSQNSSQACCWITKNRWSATFLLTALCLQSSTDWKERCGKKQHNKNSHHGILPYAFLPDTVLAALHLQRGRLS